MNMKTLAAACLALAAASWRASAVEAPPVPESGPAGVQVYQYSIETAGGVGGKAPSPALAQEAPKPATIRITVVNNSSSPAEIQVNDNERGRVRANSMSSWSEAATPPIRIQVQASAKPEVTQGTRDGRPWIRIVIPADD